MILKQAYQGRYIGENIRLLFDIMDNAEEQNEFGMIFFTDFEKAFDSLDHQYIFKGLKHLKHFNFGDNLLRWVQRFFIKIRKAAFQIMDIYQIVFQ